MALTATQIAALKTEIATDPNGLGYAADVTAGNIAGIVDLLNTVRAGAAYSIYKNNVSIHDLVSNIASSEFGTLTALKLQQIQLIFSGASMLDASDTNTRNIITGIFAGMTSTLSNFAILAKRQGSRAEVLFGIGTAVSNDDVIASQN